LMFLFIVNPYHVIPDHSEAKFLVLHWNHYSTYVYKHLEEQVVMG
jgi:hypothetical protein